jgi:hypothetical protein
MAVDLTDAPTRPALVLQLEQEMAAGGRACGARCACHGNIRCLRAAHPHDVDDAHPHLGRGPDGQLVQWVHTDQHGPFLTAGEVAEQAATARREHTLAMLETLDLDVLRAALGGA